MCAMKFKDICWFFNLSMAQLKPHALEFLKSMPEMSPLNGHFNIPRRLRLRKGPIGSTLSYISVHVAVIIQLAHHLLAIHNISGLLTHSSRSILPVHLLVS